MPIGSKKESGLRIGREDAVLEQLTLMDTVAEAALSASKFPFKEKDV